MARHRSCSWPAVTVRPGAQDSAASEAAVEQLVGLIAGIDVGAEVATCVVATGAPELQN